MTQFSKAHWSTDGDKLHMSLDFTKVNKDKRLVSGFATLDNVDSQGDIVKAEASRKAFSRARGNLREMHKKDSAVGKIVDFREKEFTYEGKTYKGIFVTARVSEGAQDTWLKVLDGTLSGFSIGGNIIDSEETFNKSGKKVRVVNDYELIELSLVDNPANQLANVFEIQKNVDGSVTVKGMAAETEILNVFFCETDKISLNSEEESVECPVCVEKMKNIGWIEDGPNREEKVNHIVSKYLSPSADANSEGGVDVAKASDVKFTALVKSETVKEEDETVETGHEAGDPTEVPTPAQTENDADEVSKVEDEGTETVEVNEVHDEGEEISKKIDEFKGVVIETLEKTRNETVEQVEQLKKQIDELQESFASKTSEFESRFAELDENFEVAKGKIASFEKNLENINSAEAFRKSADLEESPETVQKSETFWGGAFSDPKKNGAFSVNNLLR